MANRSDDFNRGGGAFLTSFPSPSDVGSNWICDTPTSAGHYFVSSSTLEFYGAGSASQSVLECSATDHEASVTLVNGGGVFWGLVVGYVDANNFIALEIEPGANDVKWKVYTSGTPSTLKTITQAVADGDVVAFGRSGTTLTFKLNGSTIDTATSSAHASATQAGLRGIGNSSAGDPRWDDFAITAGGGGGGGTPSMAAVRRACGRRNSTILRM